MNLSGTRSLFQISGKCCKIFAWVHGFFHWNLVPVLRKSTQPGGSDGFPKKNKKNRKFLKLRVSLSQKIVFFFGFSGHFFFVFVGWLAKPYCVFQSRRTPKNVSKILRNISRPFFFRKGVRIFPSDIFFKNIGVILARESPTVVYLRWFAQILTLTLRGRGWKQSRQASSTNFYFCN